MAADTQRYLANWRDEIDSAGLSGGGLFAIGALITVFTGRGALFSGGRQVLIGGAAAARTYLVGLAIGSPIGA